MSCSEHESLSHNICVGTCTRNGKKHAIHYSGTRQYWARTTCLSSKCEDIHFCSQYTQLNDTLGSFEQIAPNHDVMCPSYTLLYLGKILFPWNKHRSWRTVKMRTHGARVRIVTLACNLKSRRFAHTWRTWVYPWSWNAQPALQQCCGSQWRHVLDFAYHHVSIDIYRIDLYPTAIWPDLLQWSMFLHTFNCFKWLYLWYPITETPITIRTVYTNYHKPTRVTFRYVRSISFSCFRV